jgi:hypothetical protein
LASLTEYGASGEVAKITSNFVPGFGRQFVILRRVKLPFLIDTDTDSDDAVA